MTTILTIAALLAPIPAYFLIYALASHLQRLDRSLSTSLASHTLHTIQSLCASTCRFCADKKPASQSPDSSWHHHSENEPCTASTIRNAYQQLLKEPHP